MGDSILNVVTSHKHVVMNFKSTLTWNELSKSAPAKYSYTKDLNIDGPGNLLRFAVNVLLDLLLNMEI